MEHLWKVVFLIVLFVFVPRLLWSQETKTKLALLKYKGGGDWYANPTSLPNLIRFCNDKLGTDLAKEPATVEPGSRDIFNYPYVHMTGHGNVVLNFLLDTSPSPQDGLRYRIHSSTGKTKLSASVSLFLTRVTVKMAIGRMP